MLIHKQNVMLEARVQMRLETEIDDDGVVMAVDMSIHSVKPLEDLEDERLEWLREGHA
jgi:hypothetical protein